jgi:hypothetical protein
VASKLVLPEAGPASGAARPRSTRRPFHKDPLSLLGWGIALLSILAYWFFFVRKPVPRPGQQIARLTGVEGRVNVRPNAREAWAEARLADDLHVGDVIQTERRSAAEISFDSGSVVRVRPESVVYIGGSAEASTAAWRVQSGHVNFAAGDEVTEIVTPGARTRAMQNAAGNIDVSEVGETGVRIFQGQAEIETAQGQRIVLGENQAVRVDVTGRAGATLDLPPPPTLLAPAAKASLPVVAPPAPSARLQWSAVPNGSTYHVALDFNVSQANLLLSAALDEPAVEGTTHDLVGLAPGRYFWRVAAVTEDGLEGAFSRVSLFSVVQREAPPASPVPPKAPPTLVLEPIQEVAPGVVHVSGRTRPGASLTIDGKSVRVLPDGTFREYVRRSSSRTLVVRATDGEGLVSEEKRSLPER